MHGGGGLGLVLYCCPCVDVRVRIREVVVVAKHWSRSVCASLHFLVVTVELTKLMYETPTAVATPHWGRASRKYEDQRLMSILEG
jgi:hypothetical protein